jgi:hypothetical protein
LGCEKRITLARRLNGDGSQAIAIGGARIDIMHAIV